MDSKVLCMEGPSRSSSIVFQGIQYKNGDRGGHSFEVKPANSGRFNEGAEVNFYQ